MALNEGNAKYAAATCMFEVGAVKFGDFKLKSGGRSPVYIDLRVMQSYPQALHALAEAMNYLVHPLSFDRLVAIPHGATPLTVVMSQLSGVPMVTSREAKEYGTSNKADGPSGKVDGAYKAGMRVAVIDDVITDGGSKLDAYPPLLERELVIGGTFIVVDRMQGGARILQEQGYDLKALWPLDQLMESYVHNGMISTEQFEDVMDFIKTHQF